MRRISALFFLFFLAAAPLWAEMTDDQKNEVAQEAKNFQYQTVHTADGLNFRVPEDMPIEKRGGIEAPIPFDEYMYAKFKQIDGRLDGIEKKLDNIEKLLSSRGKPKPPLPKPAVLKSE